jgi:uncharacterized membrane protein
MPTISEAWMAYDERSSLSRPNQPRPKEHFMQNSTEQLTKLDSQSEQWQSEQRPAATALLQGTLDWLRRFGSENGVDNMSTNGNTTLNTEEIKRWSALIGGGFLTFFGLRRSFGSLAVMSFGAGLAYYALTGRSPLARFEGLAHQQNGKQGQKSSSLDSSGPMTVKNIIVKAPLHEVYAAWADFEKFPHFMQHIRSVTKTGERTSRWLMEGPFHLRLEWDAETTRLEENKRIAWSSTEGDIKTSGQVTFNALPDGQVEVTVMLKYVPPAGIAGDLFARLFNDPESMLASDLRNFKQYIEAQASHNAQEKGTNGKAANDRSNDRSDKTTMHKPKGGNPAVAETKEATPA